MIQLPATAIRDSRIGQIRRIERIRKTLGFVVVTALALPATLAGQRPTFGSTMFWETGLINSPAAYVSPLGGDISMNFARLSLDSAGLPSSVSAKGASYNISFAASLWGRAEAGVSIFSGDLKGGAFAKFLLWDQTDGMWRQGLMSWLPSVAVGARNIGTQKKLNRLSTISPNSPFNTSPSFYGVATRTFVVSRGDSPRRPKSQLSITGGWGNGLFSDDGGLGTRYAKSSTGGVFGGASLDMATGEFSALSLILEQDGWGLNAGGRYEWRGVRFALSVNEIGGAVTPPPGLGTYTGTKMAASIGWQTNFWSILRGNKLEARTQQLEERQGGLERQVRFSQQMIDVIEGQIEALNVVTTQERGAERAELERRLREEQDALRRLQELIKAREAAKKPPPEK